MNALCVLIVVLAISAGAALVLDQLSTWLYAAAGAIGRVLRRWVVR